MPDPVRWQPPRRGRPPRGPIALGVAIGLAVAALCIVVAVLAAQAAALAWS